MHRMHRGVEQLSCTLGHPMHHTPWDVEQLSFQSCYLQNNRNPKYMAGKVLESFPRVNIYHLTMHEFSHKN